MWDPNPAPSMSWPIALSTELQGELCMPLSVNTRNKKKGGLVFFWLLPCGGPCGPRPPPRAPAAAAAARLATPAR